MTKKFFLSGLMTLFLALFIFSPVFSQSNTPDAEDIRTTIKLLEDPEEAQKTIKVLKSYLKAQEADQGSMESTDSSWFADLSQKVSDQGAILQREFFEFIQRLQIEASAFPQYLLIIRQESMSPELRPTLIKFLVLWPFSILATLIMWAFTRRLRKRTKAMMLETKQKMTAPQKIGLIFRLYYLRVLPGVIFCVFTILLTSLIDLPLWIASTMTPIVIAFLIYPLIVQLITLILGEEFKPLRLMPLADEAATYILIWCRRIALFALWFFVLVQLIAVTGQTALIILFTGLFKTSLLILIAIMFAQWNEPIKARLKVDIKPSDSPVTQLGKQMLNLLSQRLYPLLVIYFSFLILFSILGYTEIFIYLFKSTLKTLIILLAAMGINTLWRKAFHKWFFVLQGNFKKASAHLLKQVNRYGNLLENGGSALVFLIALIACLDAWGLNMFGNLAQNIQLIKILTIIVLTILIAYSLVSFSKIFIDMVENRIISHMNKSKTSRPSENRKRAETLGNIVEKAFIVIIIAAAVIIVLNTIGIDIRPLLGGVGILGLAVGFGAQSLVKDIISGMFLILENHIRINDVAIINGTGGLVEQVNLRTTVLRGLDGTVHVFPNGAINTLANMTHDFSCYVFDIGVAYKEDVDQVVQVLKDIGTEMRNDKDYGPQILADFEVWGLDKFADSALIIKARIKTEPLQQWYVGREFNRRIKIKFDELGIEIPFPHQSIYFGEASKPFNLSMDYEDHEETIQTLHKSGLQKTKGVRKKSK